MSRIYVNKHRRTEIDLLGLLLKAEPVSRELSAMFVGIQVVVSEAMPDEYAVLTGADGTMVILNFEDGRTVTVTTESAQRALKMITEEIDRRLGLLGRETKT